MQPSCSRCTGFQYDSDYCNYVFRKASNRNALQRFGDAFEMARFSDSLQRQQSRTALKMRSTRRTAHQEFVWVLSFDCLNQPWHWALLNRLRFTVLLGRRCSTCSELILWDQKFQFFNLPTSELIQWKSIIFIIEKVTLHMSSVDIVHTYESIDFWKSNYLFAYLAISP